MNAIEKSRLVQGKKRVEGILKRDKEATIEKKRLVRSKKRAGRRLETAKMKT